MAAFQRLDADAIDTLGIPRLLLMEHAGVAVACAVRALAPNPASLIVICCGSGYNGGDGLAAARHLHNWGYALAIIMTTPIERLRGEPSVYATILTRLGVSMTSCETAQTAGKMERRFNQAGVIVDALLGIGAQGPVREPAASLIRGINRAGKPVVAVDVPSGLDADTGAVQGIAVRATRTVTFGLPKRGCLVQEGPAHTGALSVDAISLPPALLQRICV